jgi:hypothetical protein
VDRFICGLAGAEGRLAGTSRARPSRRNSARGDVSESPKPLRDGALGPGISPARTSRAHSSRGSGPLRPGDELLWKTGPEGCAPVSTASRSKAPAATRRYRARHPGGALLAGIYLPRNPTRTPPGCLARYRRCAASRSAWLVESGTVIVTRISEPKDATRFSGSISTEAGREGPSVPPRGATGGVERSCKAFGPRGQPGNGGSPSPQADEARWEIEPSKYARGSSDRSSRAAFPGSALYSSSIPEGLKTISSRTRRAARSRG